MSSGMLFFVLTACQTSRAESESVFARPSAYVGEEVAVCGYRDVPGNLLARRNSTAVGLNLAPGSFGPRLKQMGQRSHVCVAGPIAYAGCATDPNIICTDYAFDYTVTVRRIL